MSQKKKAVAIILAVFFGAMGAHRFYLGQVGRGILYFILWFISWMFGFIDAIIIASMSQDEFDRKYNPYLFSRVDELNAPPQRFKNFNSKQPIIRKDEYQQVQDNVQQIYREIIQLIEKSKDYDNDIVKDIKSMLDNYTNRINLLVERDKKLKSVESSFSIDTVDKTITSLQRKLTETTNQYLKDEYQTSISKYIKHKSSFQDLKDQREVVRLRINSAIMSLKQIKIDLIKMESMASLEQREQFFKTFEDKSNDLSNYLEFLEKSYQDTDFSA